MAISRYNNSRIFANNDFDYRKMYPKKYAHGDRVAINMLSTKIMDYPSFEQIMEMDYVTHVWSLGDRYYKLAAAHYGNPRYWWIIAHFNKKPTEQHIEVGDFIRVPKPLTDVLNALGY